MNGKRRSYGVSPEEFVSIWESSKTAKEAAQKLGMDVRVAHARASGYRASGIALRRMPRTSTRRLDVERLNALIKTLQEDADEASRKGRKKKM